MLPIKKKGNKVILLSDVADIEFGPVSEKTLFKAQTKDQIIMGIMHKKYNIHGVQFHPESIKTPIGLKLLKNFINYN